MNKLKLATLGLAAAIGVLSIAKVAQAYAWFEHPYGTVFGALANSNPQQACLNVYNAKNDGLVYIQQSGVTVAIVKKIANDGYDISRNVSFVWRNGNGVCIANKYQ